MVLKYQQGLGFGQHYPYFPRSRSCLWETSPPVEVQYDELCEEQNTVGGGQDTVGGGQDTVGGGQDTVGGGQDTVEGGQDTVRGGQDTVEGGQDTVGGGQDTVEGGQDTVGGGQDTVLIGETLCQEARHAVTVLWWSSLSWCVSTSTDMHSEIKHDC